MKNKEYPDGKLNKSDDGALRIALSISSGRLIIDFGKDLLWVGFDKESLKGFITALQDKYEQI